MAEPRSVRVAVWQGRSETGDVAANLSLVAEVVASSRASRVEVVLFPELFLCGYDCSAEQLRTCARAADSEDLSRAGRLAKETGVCIALPYAERLPTAECSFEEGSTTPSICNSCAVCDASGKLVFNYRKVNLWGTWEQRLFMPGSSEQLRSFDLQLASGCMLCCGVLICYDVEFPEPARCLAIEGAELLLVPTALGAGELEHITPTMVVPTRAIENHVFVMYANLEGAASGGEAQGMPPSFCGRSAILAPDGQELARAGVLTGGRLLDATLQLDAYAASVARNPYLSDRLKRWRSGHYKVLGRMDGAQRGVEREQASVAAVARGTSREAAGGAMPGS